MDTLQHIVVDESPAVPNVDRGLERRELACSDNVSGLIRDRERNDLLSVLGVEPLSVQVFVQEDHDVAHEVDYLLFEFCHDSLVVGHDSHRVSKRASNRVLDAPLGILAATAVDPLQLDIDFVWRITVVGVAHFVEPVGNDRLECRVEPGPKVRSLLI